MGHIVTRDSVEVDPAKMAEVNNWPEPETVKDVHLFLEFASYYRQFIPGFAKAAVPLVALICKECLKNMLWTAEFAAVFDRL